MVTELVAVTGGRGMIGTAVTQELKKQGYHYRTLDRIPLSKSIQDKEEHIVGSTTDPEAVERLVEGAQCLFHLARSTHDLNDLCEMDFYAMKVLIPVILKHKLEVHFSSSQAVHEIEHEFPSRRIKENYPLEPKDPYGVMKMAWERMLSVCKYQNGLKYIIYRFPCVVPAILPPDGWWTGTYWKQIQEKNKIEPGLDNERRGGLIEPGLDNECYGGLSYVHVKDVVKTWVNNIGNEQAFGSEYMLCGDHYLLRRNLAEMCQRVALENNIECDLNWPMEGSPKKGFQTFFNFDNTKAKDFLKLDVSNNEEVLLNKIRTWFKEFWAGEK